MVVRDDATHARLPASLLVVAGQLTARGDQGLGVYLFDFRH